MLRRHKKRDEAQGPSQSSNDGPAHRQGRVTPGGGWGGITSSSSSLSGLYNAGSGSGANSSSSNVIHSSNNGQGAAHPIYMQGAGQNSSSSSITRASGRAFDARRQQQQQPLAAPPSFQASHNAAPHHLQQQRSHIESSSKYGMPPSRHRHLAKSPSTDAFGSSTSPPAHAGPSSPSLGQHSPGAAPMGQMGRSQSTLNFLLSKAKNPFSSSSSSQAPSHSSHHAPASSISTSASIASFHGPTEEQMRKDNALGRHRAASASSTHLPQGAVPIDNGDAGAHAFGRSFGDDSSGVGSPSPVKRGLFGRDRKVSSATTSSASGASRSNERSGPSNAIPGSSRTGMSSYNPITRRGGRQDAGSSNYAFSKSQSDLHARQDYHSPVMATLDLPRVTEDGEQSQRGSSDSRGFGSQSPGTNAISSIDTGLLRSPPMLNAAYTRSVDDLSRSHTPEPARSQQSIAARQRGQHIERVGSSGETTRGSETHDAPSARRTGATQHAAVSALSLGGLNIQSNRGVLDSSGSEPASSLSAKRGGTTVKALSQPARTLPPGVAYEGFLNRNVNISSSIAQLSENAAGRGVREKDISKGWKPYKVVMREGRLLFYKPPNNVAEEAKNIFPTTVVADAAFGEQGISVDDVRRNKLNTQDLLSATSESTQSRPTARRMPSNQSFASHTADTSSDAPREWQRPGQHRDLALSASLNEPATWLGRIRGGPVEALAHEFAFATQANGTPSLEEARAFFYAFVFTHVFRAQRPLQSLLVALHKWAVHAEHAEKSKLNNGQTAEEGADFPKHLYARMAIVADADLLMLVDEETRSSILLLLQDIARDCTGGLVSDAELEQASPKRPAYVEQKTYDAALAQFSASYLLSCDPSSIAKQIHAYHVDKSRAYIGGQSMSAWQLIAQSAGHVEASLAVFDWKRPHFLTRLIWDHILGPGQKQSQVENGQVQAAKERASLLRHWIAVASYLLKLKDVTAWLAVCAALCSRAVARLSMTWRFVATSDRALVSTCWAPVLAKLGWSEVESPHVRAYTEDAMTIKSSINANASASSLHDTLPYLGNATLALHRVGPLGSASPGFFPLHEVASAAQSVVALDSQLKGLKESGGFRPVHNIDDGIQQAFGSMLQTYCASDSDSSSYLALSMQLEAPVLGRTEKSTSTQIPRQLAAAAMCPLAFEDPLPNLALISSEDIASNLEATAKTATGAADGMLSSRADDVATQRLASRSSLTSTPLFRTKSLSAPLSSRPLKSVPFGDVIEWTPSTPNQSVLQDDNVLKILPDLILSASSDQPPSTPSSPRIGKRFSQSVSGMNSRPTSYASKRSSLPQSERNSLVEPAALPLQVSIRAASLDRLLDVLVMGVSHLTTDMTNEEAIERMGTFGPRRQRLSMDLAHHRKIFLSTYRTVCSPTTLFDQLRRRLYAAVDAGRDMALPAVHRPSYPAWPRVQPAGTGAMSIDWEVVGKIRGGVVSVLSTWIARHSYDFVEDTELYNGVHRLAEELEASRVRNVDDMDMEKTLRSLDDLTRQLRLAVMASQSERRVSKRSSKRASANGMMTAQLGSAAIDVDTASPVEVVDYLESVVRVFFDKIDEADLLQVYEMFNHRAKDAAIWHVALYSEAASQPHLEDIPAANSMYKLLELLRWPPESRPLVQSLPAPIRDACAAQNLLRGWTAIQVIEEDIGLERRKARIGKLIDALWICRARMCNSRMDDVATLAANPSFVFAEPTVASFVESVIAGSLTSSESRLFTFAWQAAAIERGTTPDSLVGFAPSRDACESYRDSLQRSSTPDVGWLLKSLAQAVTRPPAISREDGSLLDFDKYRTVCSLIQSSVGRTKGGALDPTLVDLAGSRLSVMQQALRNVTWDRRAFKENNAREATSAWPVEIDADRNARRPKRPLGGITQRQQEKIKRDRQAYEQIAQHTESEVAASPQIDIEPAPQQKSTAPSPLPPSPLLTPTTVAPSEKKTRRMTALFRGAVRPMGLMTSSTNQERVTPDIPAHTQDELLAMTPTTKVAYVTNCGSGRVSAWSNSQRSFVFNLSPREGGHVLLQAPNGRELYEWLSAIERASKDHAVATSRSVLADSAKRNANGASSKSARSAGPPLYGTDIEVLAEHYKCSVPPGLERMLQQVEARGLREQGIYRISGAKSAIEALKVAFSTMPADSVNLNTGEFSDVHTIAGAIKQWFRDLPDPVIPYTAYHTIIDAERMDSDEDRLYAIRDLIWDFSKPHFEMLKRICEHLALVCSEGEHNLMAPHNIGLVFGTSLLNPPPSPAAVAESFGNIGKAAHIVKILVTMHEWLFESEQEQEQEAADLDMGSTKDEPPVTIDSEADAASTVPAPSDATGSEPRTDHPRIVETAPSSSFMTIPDPSGTGTSDSGMLRAVMSAQDEPTSSATEEGDAEHKAHDDAALKRARRRESVMPGIPFKAPLSTGGDAAGPASRQTIADHVEEGDEEDEDDEIEVVADAPPKTVPGAATLLPPGPRPANSTGNRRSRTESVYLDAREALAALQNPFDEGDDEDTTDGADLGDESRDNGAVRAVLPSGKADSAVDGQQAPLSALPSAGPPATSALPVPEIRHESPKPTIDTLPSVPAQ